MKTMLLFVCLCLSILANAEEKSASRFVCLCLPILAHTEETPESQFMCLFLPVSPDADDLEDRLLKLKHICEETPGMIFIDH